MPEIKEHAMEKQIVKVTEGDEVSYCVTNDGCVAGWRATDVRGEATRFCNVDTASKYIEEHQIGWGDFPGDFPVVSIESVGDET